jgi:PAS domain S-box-containing protein
MKIKTASIGFIIGLFILGSLIVGVSSISLSKTQQIQGIWLDFDSHRSDRLKALIALRSELGYGGMIHRFKNYILRQKKHDSDAILSSIGGAQSALRQYKSLQLNVTEEQAIVQIEKMLNAYQNALHQVEQLIQQNKTAKQIDNIVKIDDTSALEALKTLEVETNSIKTDIIDNQSQPLLLSSLRTAMGYGGLIHNFKNYILRHSPEAFSRVEAEVENIETLAGRYRKYKLSTIEKKALVDILSVVQIYRKNLSIIQSMSNKGELPRSIDDIVKIDDKPALEGFNSLHREIIMNNEFRAKQLNNALHVVQMSGKGIFYITLISFLILIFLAIWMMKSLIVNPISRLTQIMSRLSSNDLDVKVFGTKQRTEIGEMARSVEIFKINAVKKQEAENALQALNEHLEEKVHQRTIKLEKNEARLATLVKYAVEGEERLKILINTAMDAVIQLNEEGIIINWNKQAETMFGWSSIDVLGHKLHNLIIPEQYREQHIKGMKRFITTEKMTILNTRIEITALHHDGREFPIELTISPNKYEGHYQFSAFIRDITEKKKSELAIIQAKDEAEEANKAKSAFLANMSHELRTPMHGILSFSSLGIKKSDSATREKLHKYFSNINVSGDRLLVLLNDLLDLSKIEAGKMKLNMEKGDLADVFSSCCSEQEQHAKDLLLRVELTEPVHPVTGLFDIARIKQVVANLLSNAIKFSPKGGIITATLSKNDKQELCFSLLDNGVGIPEDELTTVFNAFIQSSKTKTGAGGTGLGLAICKEIIESHGGNIWAEKNPEGGAVFMFVIPPGFR